MIPVQRRVDPWLRQIPKSKRKRPEKLWKQAIELEPLEGAYYAILGKALWDQGEKEEGRRLAMLGLELSPEDAWLAFRVREVLGE